MRCTCAAALLVAIALLAPPYAHGQRLDPDSPAGVEYELPLERAREEASRPAGDGPGGATKGGGSSPSQGDGAAPLFGAGIENGLGRGGGGGGAGGSDPTASARDGGVPARDGDVPGRGASGPGAPSGGEPARASSTDIASSAADGGSGALTTGAIAVGVLLLGGLLGLALKLGLGRASD